MPRRAKSSETPEGKARLFQEHLCQVMVLGLTIISWSTALNLGSCRTPLGMESGAIADHQITASSSYDNSITGPTLARLNTESLAGAWCPNGMVEKKEREHFLEVNLESLHVISSVVTQGRFGNGRGAEYAEQFLLEYWREGISDWLTYKLRNGTKILKGNTNTYIPVERRLGPPIIASKIRFVPYSSHPRTVCMRTEVVGCPYDEGVLSYKVKEPQNGAFEADLTDASYDGVIDNGELVNGLGQLCDGVTSTLDASASNNFSQTIGNEWMGWNKDFGDPLEIIFQFDGVRNFSAVKVFSINVFSREVRIFSKAYVWSSHDGISFNRSTIDYRGTPDDESQVGRNVSLPLAGVTGRFLKFQLYFSAKWILISEFYFFSQKVSQTSGTEGFFNSTRSLLPENNNLRNIRKNFRPSKDQHELRQKLVAVTIGALAVVILSLVGAIILIFVKTRKQKKNWLSHNLLQESDRKVQNSLPRYDQRKFMTNPTVCRPSYMYPGTSTSYPGRPSLEASKSLTEVGGGFPPWQGKKAVIKTDYYVSPLPIPGTPQTLPHLEGFHNKSSSDTTDYEEPVNFEDMYISPPPMASFRSPTPIPCGGRMTNYWGECPPEVPPSMPYPNQLRVSKHVISGPVVSEDDAQGNFYATKSIAEILHCYETQKSEHEWI